MTISVGDTLPQASVLTLGSKGPAAVDLSTRIAGKKTVIFGLPGAFTGVCSSAHLPSFMRTVDGFRAKGVDHVICVTVNDPFVTDAWDKQSGASDAGVEILADADASFTTSIGMDFTAPPAGLFSRSQRYAMVVDDGKITHLQVEASPGECTISAGESLLETL